MARIKSHGTVPEIAVRRATHAIGLRFRLQSKRLPGKPDLVFPSRRVALFVHGCFWHQHEGCRRSNKPKSRTEYWDEKLARNVRRDLIVREELAKLGRSVVTILECETRSPDFLKQALIERVAAISPSNHARSLPGNSPLAAA
jgi:DNA mismatch endonuclease (patch repair protein)